MTQWMRGCDADYGAATVRGGPFDDVTIASVNMLFGPRTPIEVSPGVFTGWIDPATGQRVDYHYGLDLGAPEGTPLVALGYGKVIWKTPTPDPSFGNAIKCEYPGDDGYTYAAIYMHMRDDALVAVGDAVTPGQVVGYVGTTGASTGPHLHMATYRNDYVIDPLSLLVEANPVGHVPPMPAVPVVYPVPDVQWVAEGWGRATNAEGWEHAYTMKARIVKEDAYIGLVRTKREDGWDYFDLLIQDY